MIKLKLAALAMMMFALTGCAVTLTEPTATNGSPATDMPPADMTSTHQHGLTEMAGTAMPDIPETVVVTGKTANVEITLFSFKPEVLEITPGTTVTWTNNDNIEHSITQGTPPTFGGVFDSGFITKGQTFSFTFNDAGDFDYFCMRHNSMTGRIIVTAP